MVPGEHPLDDQGGGPRPLAPQRIGRDVLSINVTIEIQGSTSGANLRRGSG